MVRVDEIDFFFAVFTFSGVEQHNEQTFRFSEKVGKAPARADVEATPENAVVYHCDGHLTQIHFLHRFSPSQALEIPYLRLESVSLSVGP
jgi:hypothetical protein